MCTCLNVYIYVYLNIGHDSLIFMNEVELECHEGPFHVYTYVDIYIYICISGYI
jgi:hypothetical protein